ncbi:hypothetical protein ACFOE1_18475 [Agromyces mediolanus]
MRTCPRLEDGIRAELVRGEELLEVDIESFGQVPAVSPSAT